MAGRGTQIPTVEIFGPKGHLRINRSDLDAWIKKGYSLTPLTAPEPEEPPKVEPLKDLPKQPDMFKGSKGTK